LEGKTRSEKAEEKQVLRRYAPQDDNGVRDSRLGTRDSGLATPGLATRDSRLGTRDSG